MNEDISTLIELLNSLINDQENRTKIEVSIVKFCSGNIKDLRGNFDDYKLIVRLRCSIKTFLFSRRSSIESANLVKLVLHLLEDSVYKEANKMVRDYISERLSEVKDTIPLNTRLRNLMPIEDPGARFKLKKLIKLKYTENE